LSTVTDRSLVTAATASYLANCALGLAVSSGRFDTRRISWLHHALFASTATSTLLATGSLLRHRNPAGRRLLPALVPLSVIAFVDARRRRHVLLALAAAPFFAAATVRAWR
jgi:hypothetical protein